MHRLGRLGLALTWMTLAPCACGSTPEPPPLPDPDTARECDPDIDAEPVADGGSLGCEAGEICLQGRCYASCDDDADCGPREICASSGACVRSTASDAGTPDSGPIDPCAGVACTAPLVCDPRTSGCVECIEETLGEPRGTPGVCSSARPICDIANAACIPFGPAQCLACNSGDECTSGDGSFTGTCLLRETLGVREQVCVVACATDLTCPPGLDCALVRDAGSGAEAMLCIPPIGMPCTNWLAGAGSRSCLSDGDCASPGATLAVYPGACEGEIFPVAPDAAVDPDGALDPDAGSPDAGSPIPGACLLPCGVTDDCVAAASGQQCLGEAPATFCRIPPP